MQIINIPTCGTQSLRELDRQLIYKINEVASNSLVSFNDLDVDIGGAVWPYLQPAAKAALKRAIDDRGIRLFVNSAYRTVAQQMLLFNQWQAGRCGISAAAPPGGSNHQSGLALDIEDPDGWRPFLKKHGWKWLGSFDAVHFDFVGGGTQDIRSLSLEAFQKLWNENNPGDLISVDGQFGPETEKCLNRSPAQGFPKGQKIPEVSFSKIDRTLLLTHPNMEGEDVREVQDALVKAGINVESDGFFGPDTEKAVKKFQSLKGLLVDGKVGPGTRSKLGL